MGFCKMLLIGSVYINSCHISILEPWFKKRRGEVVKCVVRVNNSGYFSHNTCEEILERMGGKVK